MAGFGNPFNEQRQQELQDSAKEFMAQFGKEFLKMFAKSMFERIKDDVEGKADERKLKYRDWKSVERPDVFKGECFMRSGEGAGAFGGFKSVFVVEMTDYNLAVYPDRKAYEAQKKPKVIRTGGYKVARDPSWHYKSEMRHLTRGLGLTDTETQALTTFSPYSWALTHPVRENYIFQLHKAKGGGGKCACLGGGGGAVEPDDVGSEFAEKRKDYVEIFERCTSYATPRDVNSISGKGFDLTVGKMSGKFSSLSDFRDEGLEAEILVDMMVEECLTPMRDGILQDLKGPASMKLALWYKTRGLIQKALQAIATPAWSAIMKGAETVGQKIEPELRKGVEPVLEVKEKIKDKIREKLIDKMGEFLGKYVTPHIDPILKAFDKPLTKGFERGREVFANHADVNGLPDDPRQRNLQLDKVPRVHENTCDIENAASELVEPLYDIKKISDELFGSLDPYDIKNQAQLFLFETMDAAVYTLECRLDEGGKSASLKDDILQDYDHDVILARCNFVKGVVKTLLVIGFRKAISPLADPVIEGLDGFIPEDLQDFVSVAATFEEIVDLFVGEPIEQMVVAAYQRK